MEASPSEPPPDPIGELENWIEEARARGLAQPASVTFVTASPDGLPSARTVTLKRIERDSLIFTSALWTRKAREIEANPHVALLFFWPELGRQAHVAGTATMAERDLAEDLFSERDSLHQLQTIVSRQGQPIDAAELAELRARLAHLAETQEAPPKCPDDWGAFRVMPEVVELWSEAPDRLHERRLFQRSGDAWSLRLLAP
ncbi:MAG TPA: pyridoxal 5'-phosphate synthase [Solirubrobacterales bacterium]|nr:pyridoxal 5'-phosphate synthase [Solirubrobacterales bacterium]